MLTRQTVLEISELKREPDWMRDFRLQCFDLFQELPMPSFGPSLASLQLDKLQYYVKSPGKIATKWADVPPKILETFEALGIPEAERNGLAGVGAQLDSEVIYQRMQEELQRQGVVFCNMEAAVRGEFPCEEQEMLSEMVRDHFMHLAQAEEHKFQALHGAVWSGGSFIYVPPGVKVEIPIQSYYRFNEPGAGQFEHTLIIVDQGASLSFIEGCSAPKYEVSNLHAGCAEIYVGEGARVRYSTVENWSKNMFNLNTKKALVKRGGKMEWISGNFGSCVTMLYPCSILEGEGASAEYTGIALAGEGQELDTGAKMVHIAPNTASQIISKSIVRHGGKSIFRGKVKILPEAVFSKSATKCDSLILDDASASVTVPSLEAMNGKTDLGHEARIGRIPEEVMMYLQGRGLSEAEAQALIVGGFSESVAKELPLEYAVEMNNLIKTEIEDG